MQYAALEAALVSVVLGPNSTPPQGAHCTCSQSIPPGHGGRRRVGEPISGEGAQTEFIDSLSVP